MFDAEQLTERLSDLGFETDENEYDALMSAIKRAEQTIINYCNCESVPEELKFVALDMACGEYLAGVKFSKNDNVRAKIISEGDVSVTFDDQDPVDALIDELLSKGREEMVSFRRVKW